MHLHLNEQYTTQKPVHAVDKALTPDRPEFLRLPRAGTRCPLTGLSRSALNELILGSNPPVASVCLRKKGALRGCRLIVTESLLGYLHRQIQQTQDGSLR